MSLDPRIEAIRKEYGLDKDDFWQIPQNKQWVAKHAALEVVATKANVVFASPTIIEADTANGIAVLSVSGTMGNRSDWATGEASPKNCKNGYPWAMAEKRAKDRLVLKLVGIHGLVYSEDESEDFKEHRHDQSAPKSSAQLKRNGEWEKIMAGLESDLVDVQSMAGLDHLRKQYLDQAERDGWTQAWRAALVDRLEGCEADIRRNNLWEEMTNITTLGGLQSFWEENLPSIKAIGSKAVADFTKKKDEMKNAFLARQSNLAAG
ncbi:hypothetical protein CO670_15315 [Rhizobium sp. J15]|uniref:hypothetical protein n=1 Tax=Rhizobium sp. J15 TaxID=2035450 RepID=UPI000BE9F91E|nr:hypothetical protein [Rhizobium sp. J15]PDT15864.1 hypothetical protein CO670_15315 [Rhizobium sp. J15]